MKNFPAHLLRIPLRKGSRPKVDALIEYMKTNAALYENEARQKGYWWDALFYQESEPHDILWIVTKSPDWPNIKDDKDIKPTAFRTVYKEFKRVCWINEKIAPSESLNSIWTPEWKLPH
jgi:hypothetical protein